MEMNNTFSYSQILAKHLHNVYHGGNWSDVNLESVLKDVTLEEARYQVLDFNTILVLCYHINYYNVEINKAFKTGKLEARDKFSFQVPEMKNDESWSIFKLSLKESCNSLSDTIKALSEEELTGIFFDKKYGNVFSNIFGIIEHIHYHLGQIVLIKKIIRSEKADI